MGTAKNGTKQDREDIINEIFHPAKVFNKKLLTGSTIGIPVVIGTRTWIFPKPWHNRATVEDIYRRHMGRSSVLKSAFRKDANTVYAYDPQDYISD